jgi:hypothetical protein
MRPLAILAAAALGGLIAVSLSTATILPAARADPPPLGQAVSFLEPMVVCKTYPELKDAQRRLWMVHFTNAAKERWGLYEETVTAPAVAI